MLGYNRNEFLNKISPDKTVLEVGPFFSPLCRGNNVKYFDILDQTLLQKRASEIGQVDRAGDIPFIDYVSKNGDLSIINDKFDIFVSSHVIEHQFDLINHLNMVAKLLNDGGQYFLIIPDKRYCFDHFHSKSTIADVIGATYDNKEKHSIKSVIEHIAGTTHNDAKRHWDGDHGDISNNIEKIKAAIAEYNKDGYIDVHAWYFTPNSFEEIIKTLNELNLINLSLEQLYHTQYGIFEFFAVLRKNN